MFSILRFYCRIPLCCVVLYHQLKCIFIQRKFVNSNKIEVINFYRHLSSSKFGHILKYLNNNKKNKLKDASHSILNTGSERPKVMFNILEKLHYQAFLLIL